MMPWRMILCGAFVLALTGQAAVLIVKKNGESFWAESVSKNGDAYHYRLAGERVEQTIAASELFQVIPKVRRGKRYPPATVNKIIAAIEKTRKAYPKRLKKQLVPLLDEWRALTKTDGEIKGELDKIVTAYKAGEKTVTEFQDLSAQLNMLKYKDFSGQLTTDIDKTIKELAADAYRRNKKRLDALTKSEKYDVPSFREARTLASGLRSMADNDEEKSKVRSELSVYRKAVLKANAKKASEAFAARKDIVGYLAAATILRDLKRHVASDKQKDTLNKRLKALIGNAGKANKKFDLRYKGYPFTSTDQRNLKANKGKTQMFALSQGIDERCLILASPLPAGLKFGQDLNLSLHLLFRANPPEGETAIIARFDDASGVSVKQAFPIKLALKEGHVQHKLRVRFADWDDTFRKLERKSGNNEAMFIYLGVAETDANGERQWRMLSQALAVALTVP